MKSCLVKHLDNNHEGCFSFGPEHIQSPDIWSPTIGPQEQTVPAHLVPKTIGPPGQLVPQNLVPMDKWSPRQLVPLDKQSPNIWSPWTIGPQNLLVVFKSDLKHFLQFFDIWWSIFDITDDFKPIFKMGFLKFW